MILSAQLAFSSQPANKSLWDLQEPFDIFPISVKEGSKSKGWFVVMLGKLRNIAQRLLFSVHQLKLTEKKNLFFFPI